MEIGPWDLGEDSAPAGDPVDELIEMISELASYIDTVPAGLSVDPSQVAGTSGPAQENRILRHAQARFAADRATLAREGLKELLAQSRARTCQVQAYKVLREARLELTPGERLELRDLWAVASHAGRVQGPRTVVDELLECARAIPRVAHAEISVWDRRGGLLWAEASDEVARALSIVQSVTGGPGRDAAENATSVHAKGLGVDGTGWSRFLVAALDMGVHALVSVPVHDGIHAGSLTLYSQEPDGIGERGQALGQLLGSYTGVSLRLLAARGSSPSTRAD